MTTGNRKTSNNRNRNKSNSNSRKRQTKKRTHGGDRKDGSFSHRSNSLDHCRSIVASFLSVIWGLEVW